MKAYLFFFSFIISNLVFADKPKVVILGVDHSSQLINYHQQPAAIRAFVDKVNPSAICIERSPEEFSKNDFYEFTYEQQYTIIPYAKDKKIPLYPIDWLPSSQDLELVFGVKDMEYPNFTRHKSGFHGFTSFVKSSDFEDSLYFADNKNYIDSIALWYKDHPEKNSFDFPRRLFLYRTFLQSKRIQKVLESYKSTDTILVVIGAFHKNDIELNLKECGFDIIKPHFFGQINDSEIESHFTKQDAYAILSFNLLGVQNQLGRINHELVQKSFDFLRDDTSIEKQLLEIKFNLFTNSLSSEQAIIKYLKILELKKDEDFSWTGVRDFSRVDSYFDPFGNIKLMKRIRLELAREYKRLSKEDEADKQILWALEGLNKFKSAMLKEYINSYLF